MLFDFANVLVFLALAIAFATAVMLAGRFIRPRIPEVHKDIPYECGEKPVGNAWIQFNFRFYLVAIVFVIFDVEIAFMFPVAAVFRNWVETGRGALALVEVLVFVLILFVGLIYVWSKGDLRWNKAVAKGGMSS
ncbi:MAG TPA: NADH-quinone oxidoreductase subunit A [Candidatus Krumholzibacteria bacterium]|jgi:NADH-quinone oxidoreductase subunit A|nr:NADH-quinone oxidoreductase subunit A [Candidatus Krumholzibacteria bacterium]